MVRGCMGGAIAAPLEGTCSWSLARRQAGIILCAPRVPEWCMALRVRASRPQQPVTCLLRFLFRAQELLAVVDELGGRFLVTSDHGNADDMVQRAKKTFKPILDEGGKPVALTSHTLAPVPLAVGGAGLPSSVVLRDDLPEAGLSSVAATVFNLLGYEAPAHMEPSLIAQ